MWLAFNFWHSKDCKNSFIWSSNKKVTQSDKDCIISRKDLMWDIIHRCIFSKSMALAFWSFISARIVGCSQIIICHVCESFVGQKRRQNPNGKNKYLKQTISSEKQLPKNDLATRPSRSTKIEIGKKAKEFAKLATRPRNRWKPGVTQGYHNRTIIMTIEMTFL